MIPTLKSCYVLLNRNFLNLRESIKAVNYFPVVETENCEKSYQNNILDRKTISSKINEEKHYDLRNNDQIKYSDDGKNTPSEISNSEFSYDSSSSDDGKTPPKRKMIHGRLETNPKKLSCLLCNKVFSSHISYLKHTRSHELKPFKCILCRKKCGNRPSFLNHMKRLHPEVNPFICDYRGCERDFTTQNHLEIHRKMHWRYMCKYCKKLFVRKCDMKKHVLKIH